MKQTRFKRITVSSMLCLLLMCVFLPLVSAAAATPTAAAAVVTVEKDGTTEVAISLEANPGLWGMRLKVGYDHEALTLQRADAGTVFTEEEITPPENLEQESYIFMADRMELSSTVKNGVLTTLTFAVKSGAELKDYPITLTVVDALDAEGNTVALTCAAGKITVVNCLHDGEKTIVGAKDATFQNEGYTGDTKCNDCGEIVEIGKTIPKLTPKPSITYSIVQGANGEWRTDAKEGYSFTVSGSHVKFQSLKVDGMLVDASQYTAIPDEDNVRITLKSDYLKTLSAGKHTVTILFSDGEASGTFAITESVSSSTGNENGNTTKPGASDNPQTGDNTPIISYMLLAFGSLAAIVVITKKRKFKVVKK